MLSERPKCPVHKKDMELWQFQADKDSPLAKRLAYGFKCAEQDCEVIYADDFGGFCTLTIDGKPIPFVREA